MPPNADFQVLYNQCISAEHPSGISHSLPIMAPPLSRVSLIFACGTALFSDGYVNSVIGTVVNIIRRKFGDNVITTNQDTTINSIGFAGTVVGMLSFGYISDKFGRKFGMVGYRLIQESVYISITKPFGIGLDDGIWNHRLVLVLIGLLARSSWFNARIGCGAHRIPVFPRYRDRCRISLWQCGSE